MSPSLEVLRERRKRARDRERHLEKRIKKEGLDLKFLLEELEEETAEKRHLLDRKREFHRRLREEAEADATGEGIHPEKWEGFVENRIDELADLVDAAEARMDRLVQRAAEHKTLIKELRRKHEKAEARVRRILKQIEDKKATPQNQLTKDFHVEEFNCKDGTRIVEFCPYMIPHLRAICQNHLQPLRDSGGSVWITSGLRHYAYNLAIGGATYSYHRYEYRKEYPAVDHIQSGRSAPEVQRWYDSHTNPNGMGYYSGFTHIDPRPYRSRWYGAS